MWTRNTLKTSQFNWQWKHGDSVTCLHTVSKKSVWQCCYETGVCKTSFHLILESEKMHRVKRNVEYSPWSPDLTPLDFYLWGDLKNTVCTRKPRRLQELRQKTEIASAAIPPASLWEVYLSVAGCYQQCIGAAGGHFEHLFVYEFKVTRGTVG
jgi:hypothetical protein